MVTTAFKSLRKRLNDAVDDRDCFVFGGLGMVGWGLWGYHPRVSIGVCGLILMLLGLGWLTRGPN